MSSPQNGHSSRSLHWVIVIILFILVLLLVAGGLYFFVMNNKTQDTSEDGYQALFLSNGQVYFGQIQNESKHYVELADVYYLQLSTALQEQQIEEGEHPDLSLVKLGSELHGPEDKMYINRDHLLFIEYLKDDSKVMRAIKNHKIGVSLE